MTESTTLVVLAGADREQLAQGLVVLLHQRSDSAVVEFVQPVEEYRTPVQAGRLRVVDAVGERLTLESTDGTLFVFDVPLRSFLSPAGTPIRAGPTATPFPR